MEPISLIIGALSTAASSVGNEVVKKVAGDAYEKLKALIVDRIRAGKADSTKDILDKFEQKPDVYKDPLTYELKELGIASDADVIQAAEALLKLMPQGKKIIAQYYCEYHAPVTRIERVEHLTLNVPKTGIEEPGQQGIKTNSDQLTPALEAYLRKVMTENRMLPLEGIDPEVRRDGGSSMHLDGVYTPLFARSGRLDKDMRFGGFAEGDPREHDRQVPLVELFNTRDQPCWVLLGDPGYGKTTFACFLTFCMAGALLGSKQGNLEHLKTPLPVDDNHAPDPYNWELGALLPLKVVLRRLADHLCLAENCPDRLNSFWNALVAAPAGNIEDAGIKDIQQRFRDHGGILILDGLDEVPGDASVRFGIKELIRVITETYDRVRILVTSRPYAYEKKEWQLPGFAVARLTPFNDDQIRAFIRRWYDQAALNGPIEQESVAGGIADLSRAVFATQSLLEFSRSPLLLTLLARLHVFRGRHLPEKREAIYAQSLELLLDIWERHKKSDGGNGDRTFRLSEELGMEQDQLLRVIAKLAYEVHKAQGEAGGTERNVADIPVQMLMTALMDGPGNRDIRPKCLEEFLSCRAGILVDRGEGVYCFPHRTFQEYLAARYLTELDDNGTLIELTTRFPGQWREVGLLSAARSYEAYVPGFWDLIDGWCPGDLPEPETLDNLEESKLWGALMAGLAVAESVKIDQDMSGRRQEKLARLRPWLLRIVRGKELPAFERAAAGNALAKIGDSRFYPELFYLPREKNKGFIEVPEGVFWMGTPDELLPKVKGMADDDFYKQWVENEMPCHRVDVPRFFIARYPITKAQFRVFVQDTDHKNNEFEDYGEDNHPVACVNWHDAQAYCQWLNSKNLFSGMKVALPTEAQWEKAARWGTATLFPWGDEIEPEQANYSDSSIHETCCAGCFQRGGNDDRPLDMIGNVWEWTMDHFHDTYNKAPDDGCAWIDTDADEGTYRVFRGGAFRLSAERCRSACRDGDHPSDRIPLLGFRLVLLPGR
ncbi:MAG: SUMF1/EgtB/PvdO family nonheme iron enzyme [Desulfobacter postgatei]|uniref:SUMF1/EgtB/PvdO family nonheme iron enzyme n=1 Tax=Desulfobacter postgatei TaxID=2293 RepID=UPI0023F2A6F1|nr:SUMF1/EgtB/PvdO family nonheme iron enzyme [Desulfobacter postgatei]MDD4272265.1 SUMF1/EgtB/PvdO family nonheme iron enzyme [Desulfobacter postgatei]